MAATNISKSFIQWVMGFRSTTAMFEAPWNEAGFLDSTCQVRIDDGDIPGVQITGGTTAKVGRNVVRMVHGMRNSRHYIAVSEEHSTVLVEYHTSNPNAHGDVCAVMYDYERRIIKGAQIELSKTTQQPVTAKELYSSQGAQVSTPAAILMAILVGELLAGRDAGKIVSGKDAWYQDVKTVADLLFTVSDDDERKTPFKAAMAYLAMKLYESLSSGSNFLNKQGNFPELMNDSAGKMEPLLLEDIDGIDDFVCAEAFFPEWNTFANTKDPVLVPYELTASGARMASMKASGNVLEDLRKEVKLPIHPLTEEEEKMIPRMGDNYVVDAKLAGVAREIAADWHRPGLDLAANIILEGDAGSGKTAGSRFLADVFGIPYTKVTMNPMYESADLIGAFYPYLPEGKGWNATDEEVVLIDQIRKEIGTEKMPSDMAAYLGDALGNRSVRELIREAYNIPDDAEVEFDPEESWIRLGGKKDNIPDQNEIIMEAQEAFNDKAFRLISMACRLEQEERNSSVKYKFIESEILKAFRNGWLLEIQEAASVLRPGVLTQLNSLLESKGRIELPNGKHVYRHPDTIVVFTTNAGYAGNADINESLRDRCTEGLKMDLPSPDVMAARAVAQTGFSDYDTVLAAAKTIAAVADEAKAKNIRGSFGMRSLLAWCCSLQNNDFSEDAFLRRVIYKMTTRDDDVQLLMTVYRANCPFVSRVARKKEAKV